jgi:hypothetical protein
MASGSEWKTRKVLYLVKYREAENVYCTFCDDGRQTGRAPGIEFMHDLAGRTLTCCPFCFAELAFIADVDPYEDKP